MGILGKHIDMPASSDASPRDASASTVDAATLDRILTVIEAAARAAGALIRAHAGRVAVDEKSGHQDLVTDVDKACQALIVAAIADAFPGDAAHALLGEEDVAPGRAASIAATKAALARPGVEFLYVVDPIDGTTNFVAGIPFSVVSIGVAHRGVVVAAAIFEPFRDELFTAARGRGAALNGARIETAAAATLREGVWGFGTHSNPRVGHVMLRVAAALLERVRGLRSLGSACLMLAYVAAGRLQGYVEQDLNAWDLAAGALIVEEAGGAVSDMRGARYVLETRDVCASSGRGTVHADALVAIRDARAESSEDTYRE